MNAILSISDLNVVAPRMREEPLRITNEFFVTVDRSEVVSFIGESGAGKTTAALAALGYARPGTKIVSGSVIFEGRDILEMSIEEKRTLRGRDIAYVAQSAQAALSPSMPIGQQIVEAMRLHKVFPGSQATERTAGLLGKLGFPDPSDLLSRYPHQASGGQQQRVMLAMAMACEPKLLILDEPTTALDVTTQVEVLKLIKQVIRETGTAAVYVSHDLSVIAQVADRVLVMKEGDTVDRGTIADIINAPKSPYTRTLIDAAPRGDSISNRTMTATPPIRVTTSVQPALEVRNVSASYERSGLPFQSKALSLVLHDVSLKVMPGEVLAIVGESGCGKSTLARVVAGLHSPVSGGVLLEGHSLAGRARRRTLEDCRRVQMVFQSPYLSLNPARSVGEILGGTLDLYFKPKRQQRRDRIVELLEMAGLDASFADKLPVELSGGQRQRVSLARAFAARADVIICDEVLAALDVVVAGQILDTMRELQRRSGVSYLFISHDLVTVSKFADRVAVIYGGRIMDIGTMAQVFGPARHPYTELLLNSSPELRPGWLEEVSDRGIAMATTIPVDSTRGCCFRQRCPVAKPGVCDQIAPTPTTHEGDRSWLCHYAPEDRVRG